MEGVGHSPVGCQGHSYTCQSPVDGDGPKEWSLDREMLRLEYELAHLTTSCSVAIVFNILQKAYMESFVLTKEEET